MRSLVGGIGHALRNGPPVPYSGTIGSGLAGIIQGLTGRADPKAAMTAMGSVGTLFSIVSLLSNSTAQVKWHLWRKAASGLDEDRIEITSHAALDLWAKPNPFMPRQEFVEVVQQHVDLCGEGWWIVGRIGNSIPLELWPVRPDRMAPVPHPTKFLSGYVYTGPDGEKIGLGLNEVIMLRLPDPMDPYRGMGPVGSVLVDLEGYAAATQWNRNFFRNSAEPGGIIEIPEMMEDEEFNRLRARWNEQHRGVTNAHRVAILETGKWVDRKYTMKDMQFTELRRVSREVIREAFRVHGHMLGLSEDINRANAEAADEVHARWQTIPRLERIKGALNNDLLPMYGTTARDLEWDYENPVPEDQAAETADFAARVTAYVALVGASVDPAAAAAVCELPDDIATMVPKPDPIVVAPPVPGQPAPDPNAPQPPDAPPAPTGRARRWLDAMVRRAELRAAQADTAPEDRLQADWQGALDGLVTAWSAVTAAQLVQLLDQIRTAVDRNETETLGGLAIDSTAGAALLTGAMVGLYGEGAQSVVDEAAAQGVQDVHPASADEATLGATAAAAAALLASGLAAAAGREALRLATPDATGDQVSDAVREYLDGLGDRALRDQLGGALHTAQHAGRMDTLRTAPTARYYASEHNDANACEPCSEVDGREYVDLAAAEVDYPTGRYVDCLGRDRCRGQVMPVWTV